MSNFWDYGLRDAAGGKIIFTRVQQKRPIAIKYWFNNRNRLNEETAFETGTTGANFVEAIKAASERMKFRKDHKKVEETLITAAFQGKLETGNKWDRWVVKLESNLKTIIGAKGVALSYVIREDETPDPTIFQPWESIATHAAHHNGSAYDQDKLTVHNIIIRNIADGSDAYTYVKPHIKQDDGRRDIKVLHGWIRKAQSSNT